MRKGSAGGSPSINTNTVISLSPEAHSATLEEASQFMSTKVKHQESTLCLKGPVYIPSRQNGTWPMELYDKNCRK